MVKGCGRKFSKVLMNIFNILILLIGAGIIAVTAWALANGGNIPGGWGDSGPISSGVIVPQSLLWAALALGILAVLVPILGFCAANGKKKHCFSLSIFTILVMLIGLAILAIGVAIYLFGTWGYSLKDCNAATSAPNGDVSSCYPPAWYSQGVIEAFSQTYTECNFDGSSQPGFCAGSDQQAQICLGIYTTILEPGATQCPASGISYDQYFNSMVDYIAPWSFTAGIVCIVLGGAIFLMSIPAICLCCAPSKQSREKEEVREEAMAQRAAAAGAQAGGEPVTGNTRYV